MIFTDDAVDIPERLLDSLTKDRLVVFVGAGVSMRAYKKQPPETCYPGFPELAGLIAERLSRTITDRDKTFIKDGFIDRIIGEWDDTGGDVRQHAAAILQFNESGQRLILHRAIIRLLAGTPTPRIVTTNFDRLLLLALEAENLSVDRRWRVAVAPALPPTRRFSGICYLHGRVNEPQDMVLTDKDIGRAYMDEGWALRFAHNIFQQFDVLFVGYSLEDPPLRYLSLALEGRAEQGSRIAAPSRTSTWESNGLRRWALIPKPNPKGSKHEEVERDWQRRNVQPIWFSAKNRDYRALEKTIHAWGTDQSRSFLDRRNVLEALSNANPDNLTPHDLARANYFLQEPASLRDLARLAIAFGWFDKLFSWGRFDHLIKGTAERSEADGFLADRFVDWMIRDPVDVLGRTSQHRPTMNNDLFNRFCQRYQDGRAEGIDVPMLRQIIEFFRPVIGQKGSFLFALNSVKRILSDLLDAGVVDDAFWLLGIALQTVSDVTKTLNFEYEMERLNGRNAEGISQYEMRYELRFESQIAEHGVREVFSEIFLPRMSAIGFRFTHFLTLKFLELRAISSRGKTRNMDSHRARPAIAPHPQNFGEDPVHFLLDLLRDCWEALLAVNRDQAERIYWFWEPVEDQLVQRLRIHALTKIVEVQS
jgi:hypothetical protein